MINNFLNQYGILDGTAMENFKWLINLGAGVLLAVGIIIALVKGVQISIALFSASPSRGGSNATEYKENWISLGKLLAACIPFIIIGSSILGLIN